MFIFVIGIILCIVSFIFLGFNLSNGEWEDGAQWKINIKHVVSIVILVAGTFISCINIVPTGNTGIITIFGQVQDSTLSAGIHFLAPWESVICMDNRTQKKSLDLSCFSSDIQETTVKYTINYQIDKENAQTIYRTIGTEYFTTVVEPKALEAIKGVFAKYNAENLISSRGQLSKEVEEILKEDLSVYNIQIVATSIENIDFTDAFTNAVESKQVSEQNKLKAKIEQDQAIIEAKAAAERKKIEAQAEADANTIKAKNDAEVAKIQADSAEYQGKKDAAIMDALGRKLKDYPELIQYYYANGWDGKLPETMLSDGLNTLFNVK